MLQEKEKMKNLAKFKDKHYHCIHLKKKMQKIEYLNNKEINEIREKYKEKNDISKNIKDMIHQRFQELDT